MRSHWTGLGAVTLMSVGLAAVAAQSKPDALRSEFENPPAQARPIVWCHWMNGNITPEGIKLDLDWMYKVGLNGFQTLDAGLSTPLVVEMTCSRKVSHRKLKFSREVKERTQDEEESIQRRADHRDFEAA